MKIWTAVAAGALLGGCQAMLPQPFDMAPLQARSHSYEGRSVSDILVRLGAPNSRERIGPATWFAWEYISLQDTGVGVSQWQCRLSAAVDDGGTVLKVTSTGNVGGCKVLLGRL